MTYGIHFTEPERRTNCDRLFPLSVATTRFVCSNTTDVLGINDDVYTLLDRIGWLQALGWSERKTYLFLVKEVLSTLDVKRMAKRGHVRCTFRMGNRDRVLTVEDVNQIFNAPDDGIYHPPSRYDKDYAYRLFCLMESDTEKYDSSLAKASAMPNPVFRYLHRILASTVFDRRENDGLRTSELFTLWALLNAVHLNFGAFFLEQLQRQAHMDNGWICIGGLVTPIAEHFNVDLDDYNERLPRGIRDAIDEKPEGGGDNAGDGPSNANFRRGRRYTEEQIAGRFDALDGYMMTMDENMQNWRTEVYDEFGNLRQDLYTRFDDIRSDMHNRMAAAAVAIPVDAAIPDWTVHGLLVLLSPIPADADGPVHCDLLIAILAVPDLSVHAIILFTAVSAAVSTPPAASTSMSH
ncbi:hypothetical protein C2S52_018765 [Perilla frutescens var. hirtella]|nr:hypothetical protein C2S52_018765 [Perilla frutescens var. hirtella]